MEGILPLPPARRCAAAPPAVTPLRWYSPAVRDGKIVEGWNVLDQLGMLTQLGAVAMS
jgi:hypothetical protein